jgi:hypothetical protein
MPTTHTLPSIRTVLVLVLALVLTTLAGCADSSPPGELFSPQTGQLGADMQADDDTADDDRSDTADGGTTLDDGGDDDDADDNDDAGVDDDDQTAALRTRRKS